MSQAAPPANPILLADVGTGTKSAFVPGCSDPSELEQRLYNLDVPVPNQTTDSPMPFTSAPAQETTDPRASDTGTDELRTSSSKQRKMKNSEGSESQQQRIHLAVLGLLNAAGVASVTASIWSHPDLDEEHTLKVRPEINTARIFNMKSRGMASLDPLLGGFLQPHTMPFHMLAVISLLIGKGEKRDIYRFAYEKWKEVGTYCSTKCGTMASKVLGDVMRKHAATTTKRYKLMLYASKKAVLCSTRAKMLEIWIDSAKRMIDKHWETYMQELIIANLQAQMAADDGISDDEQGAGDELEDEFAM